MRAIVSVFLLIPQFAFAGPLLDYIRNYDLHDYALGIAITDEQNPYIGAENSVFAYPFLTSFHDSALTDDWLLIRDGDIGLRWVNETGWELGAADEKTVLQVDGVVRLGNYHRLDFGYNLYGMELSSSDESVNGRLKVRHHGPMVFLTIGY